MCLLKEVNVTVCFPAAIYSTPFFFLLSLILDMTLFFFLPPSLLLPWKTHAWPSSSLPFWRAMSFWSLTSFMKLPTAGLGTRSPTPHGRRCGWARAWPPTRSAGSPPRPMVPLQKLLLMLLLTLTQSWLHRLFAWKAQKSVGSWFSVRFCFISETHTHTQPQTLCWTSCILRVWRCLGFSGLNTWYSIRGFEWSVLAQCCGDLELLLGTRQVLICQSKVSRGCFRER